MPLPDGLPLDHSGGAVATTLIADISDSVTSISVLEGSTYPQAANGKYAAVRIDAGNNNEEIIFYSGRVGNQLQNCLRGKDGTSAFAHGAGATVEHVFTALEAHQANAHYSNTDPAFVPHVQSVHTTQAQTISANHTFTGTITHSGPTNFTGAVAAQSVSATTLDIDTIAGPFAVTGAITYADTAADPKVIAPTSVAAKGTSRTPMASDAQLSLDTRAIYRMVHPAGEIIEWPYAALPQHIVGTDGLAAGEWKWADGSQISATAYPAYYANAGTTHGGTASLPALPDRMNGRVPVGVDGAHGLNQTGGSLTHTNSVNEMATHTVTINDPGHRTSVDNAQFVIAPPTDQQSYIPFKASNPPGAGGAGAAQATFTALSALNPTNITVNPIGGNQPFNIEQPWVGTKYIVKTH